MTGGEAMTDREMLTTLLALVNDSATLPATAKLDYLDATGTAASLQQLGGTRLITKWIGGGGIGQLPFAVWLRTDGNDTAGRLDAASALLALSDALEAATLTAPMLSISGESTPALVERDGTSEVWRAGYMLESERAAP